MSSSPDISYDLKKVAIVGRPNVGKSTLFNLLTETRKAVVKDQRGVTRDIQVESAEVWGKNFDLMDTGGLTESQDVFSKLIREQVVDFLDTVDLLILVMDGRDGLLPEDRDVLRIVKETGKPYCLLVNKIDKEHESDVKTAEFHEFGVEPFGVSFEQRIGLSKLLEWLHKNLPENAEKIKDGLTLAIVGKPNAGKSSIVNKLLGEDRMLVSPIAGTTVDSIDTPFIYKDKKYILIDTAGLRKSAKREEDIEIIAAFKSRDSIHKANVVLLVIDAMIGPTDQDARILQTILEEHKGVLIVANKLDIAEKEIPDFKKTFQAQMESTFHFYRDLPVVFTSATTGWGMKDLLEGIEWMNEKLHSRIKTADLNEFFFETIRKAPSPVYGVHNVKFYYLTQTQQVPPAFIAFANHPDGVDNAYRRFLIKNMKERFDLWGVPIRIFVMKSRSK